MDSENKEVIISLLPSATEILFALGAGNDVVGVTHECPEEMSVGRVACTANLLPAGLSASDIDAAVTRSLQSDAHTIYRLDVDAVRSLHPTTIVTQRLCAVCAVPEDAVRAVACTFPQKCKVVSADPHKLRDLFDSIQSIARRIGRTQQAEVLVKQLKERLATVEKAVVDLHKPRVMVLEWPDPPYAPGHWVPDMISSAGGECVLGLSGEKSKRATWDSILSLNPDVVICAFCGYDLSENEREVDKIRESPQWVALTSPSGEGQSVRIFATDASSYFSRPGPRLIDGTELLAYILHGLPAFRPRQRGRISELIEAKWVDASENFS